VTIRGWRRGLHFVDRIIFTSNETVLFGRPLAGWPLLGRLRPLHMLVVLRVAVLALAVVVSATWSWLAWIDDAAVSSVGLKACWLLVVFVTAMILLAAWLLNDLGEMVQPMSPTLIRREGRLWARLVWVGFVIVAIAVVMLIAVAHVGLRRVFGGINWSYPGCVNGAFVDEFDGFHRCLTEAERFDELASRRVERFVLAAGVLSNQWLILTGYVARLRSSTKWMSSAE
jgi:hypothetical protein